MRKRTRCHLLEDETGCSVMTEAPLWVVSPRGCAEAHDRMTVLLLVSQERPASPMALVGTLAPQLANMAVCYLFLSWVNRRSRRIGGSAARQVRLGCITAACFVVPFSHLAHAVASQLLTSCGCPACSMCTGPGQSGIQCKECWFPAYSRYHSQ